jgi:hypothetical protein
MFLDKKGNGTNGNGTEHGASNVSSGTSGRLGLGGAGRVTGRLGGSAGSRVASRDNGGDGLALVVRARGDGLGDDRSGNESAGGVSSNSGVVLSRGNSGSSGNGGNNGELHF